MDELRSCDIFKNINKLWKKENYNFREYYNKSFKYIFLPNHMRIILSYSVTMIDRDVYV